MTKTLIFQIGVALAIICWCLWSIIRPVNTVNSTQIPRLDYHAPPKCKSGSLEHIYYSVGETVLAYPYVELTYISPLEPSLLRDVPDPNDELGCLGNPFQMQSLAFGTKQLRGELFWNWRPRPDDNWNTYGVRLLELMCKDATIVENLPIGLKACRVKPTNPPDLPKEVWPVSYVADHEKYTTPTGKPFVVNCDGGAFILRDPCTVGYSLRPDLGISYTFDPYKKSTPLPVDQIFDEDRKFQETFKSFVVKEFKWPTPIKLPKEN
jgi:hypothetical protein